MLGLVRLDSSPEGGSSFVGVHEGAVVGSIVCMRELSLNIRTHHRSYARPCITVRAILVGEGTWYQKVCVGTLLCEDDYRMHR